MHVLRKFLEGLIFGIGLAIAFVVVWSISMAFVIPRVMESATTHSTAPKFENPTDAQVAAPDPSVAGSTRDFSFFKHSGERMKIPQGGGVLAMALTTTAPGAKRPSTYSPAHAPRSGVDESAVGDFRRCFRRDGDLRRESAQCGLS